VTYVRARWGLSSSPLEVAALLAYVALTWLTMGGGICMRFWTGTRGVASCAALAIGLVAICGVSIAAASPVTRLVGQDGADNGDCTATPCATIQYAIAAANDGDTVEVGAGTYVEQLTVAKAVTLRGPNAGVDPNTGSRGPEAIIEGGTGTAITPQAAGIVVDGFTVSTADSGFPIYTGVGDIDDLTISNDIVGSGVRAITVETGADRVSIEHDLIEGDVYGVIFAAGDYSDLKIDANVFAGSADSTALFNDGESTFDGFELEGNTILSTSSIGGTVSDGMISGNSFDVDLPGAMNLQIDLHESTLSGNSFDGNGTTACLQLFGDQYGLDPSNEVTVSGNSFERCAPYGIQLSPGVDHIAIAGNTISRSFDGIATRDVTPWDLSGKDISVSANRITNSTHMGVDNTVEGTLDARDNWWGCNAGPTSNGSNACDAISAGVDASPWLVLTASASSASIMTGESATVTARLDTDSAGAAVDGIRDGASVAFGASLGSLLPASAPLTSGTASATFTADARAGDAGINVALDGEQVAVPLSVVAPAPAETTPPPRPPSPPAPVEGPPVVKPSANEGPKDVPASGQVTVASVTCPSGTCEVAARSPKVTIGGKAYKIQVKLPKLLSAGDSAPVRVVLSKAARRAFAEEGKGRVTLRLIVTASDGTQKTVKITVVLKDKQHKRGGR